MKTIIFILLSVCLLGLYSCNKTENAPPHFTDGNYNGTMIIDNSVNNTFSSQIDTAQFSINLKNLTFSKSTDNWISENCEGMIEIDASTIRFVGDNCGCWCDCLPHVDCGGDIILGTYLYEMGENQLNMWTETPWKTVVLEQID